MSAGGTSGDSSWRYCSKCGIEVDIAEGLCRHGGAAIDAETTSTIENVPPALEGSIPRYYQLSGPKQRESIYVQQAESWVVVTPAGARSRTSGSIPRALLEVLREIPRVQAEAEIARRDAAFSGSLAQRALWGDRWQGKVLLALPGLPATAVYFFAICSLGGSWPTGPGALARICVAAAAAVIIGALVNSLLWEARAVGDELLLGAVLGAVVGVGLIFVAYMTVRHGPRRHYWRGIWLAGVVLGGLLGLAGGGIGGWISGLLRRPRADGQERKIRSWHVAAAIGALGVIFAIGSGLSLD